MTLGRRCGGRRLEFDRPAPTSAVADEPCPIASVADEPCPIDAPRLHRAGESAMGDRAMAIGGTRADKDEGPTGRPCRGDAGEWHRGGGRAIE
ncbi:MAG: hypothetical protein A2Z32_12910 [Chloroflexi bacterium RBG_16_69_14]|nr:MAG: hypothetical protein A2Z32_12910 [Chloroflexi bacterium RBG_16_69_14]